MKKVSITFRRSLLMLLVSLLLWPAAFAQSVVTGTVLDSFGEPVTGASVVEKGTTNGVITDIDGNFSLKMQNDKNKLAISYVGMATQEVASTPGKAVKVTLEENNAMLDDVVVVGYGSKARKDLTGSVGSISGAKLSAVPVASASEALAGKIAGVQVTTVDGQPGADVNIRVRGATSVTQSNSPLFIVDGFQVDNINDIPPSDIQSIDVLKDASLTAIYGAKGGNGVVVVTTKNAQAGKVQVTFNGRMSLSHISRTLDLMNTSEFVDYQYDRAAANGTRSAWAKAFRGDFGNPQDIALYKNLSSNDWQDEVLGNTPLSYQGNVTIGGGNETNRFNLSVSQSEDKGIILGSGVRRTVVNLKLNSKISKNLEFTYNPKMTYRRDEGAGGANVGSGGLIDVLRYRPTAGLRSWGSYAEMENEADASNFLLTNPVNDIKTNTQKKHAYNVVNQMSLKWSPIKGLIIRSEGNFNLNFRETQRFYGAQTSKGKEAVNQNKPVAVITNRNSQSYTWTNTATYDMEIDDTHNLSFLLGQEIYHSQYKEVQQAAHLFASSIDAKTAFNNMALGSPYAEETKSSLSTSNRTASFFGQASYNYEHKYFISGTLRADGSTKFAPGNQWGYFPSVSGAWDVKKEAFLEDYKWLDQVKLRAAYGLAGNNNISDDLWRYLYEAKSTGGPGFGEATVKGDIYYDTPSSYPNKDIKWETTITRNLALDLSFFKGRLTVTPELYSNITRDLLYSSPIATVSGYSKQMQNIGKVANKGWELSVNGDFLRGKDYVLSGNFTLGRNKMTVKKLNNTDDILYNTSSQWKSTDEMDYLLRVGGEVGLFYGYVYDGLYSWEDFHYPSTSSYLATPNTLGTVDGVIVAGTMIDGADSNSGAGIFSNSQSGYSTMPGKIRVKDLNHDGKIDEQDKTVIGNTNPKWQGGFGLSGSYKNWDFSANFTYMLDFDVYNATAYALSSSSKNQYTYYNVLSKFANNRWRYTYRENGECAYKNTYMDDAQSSYYALNAHASTWNPADVINNVMLSYFVEDGSFIRCTDITIGYTVPKNITKNLGLSKVRAYLSGSNLFTLTHYSGYDPEVDIQSGLTPSMDYNRYPRSRTYSFGVNVTF